MPKSPVFGAFLSKNWKISITFQYATTPNPWFFISRRRFIDTDTVSRMSKKICKVFSKKKIFWIFSNFCCIIFQLLEHCYINQGCIFNSICSRQQVMNTVHQSCEISRDSIFVCEIKSREIYSLSFARFQIGSFPIFL